MSGITYWLAKSKTPLEKLARELHHKFATYEDIQPDKIHEIPYLNACIEEGLRMFPPAPHGPSRVSPGANVSGFYVPPGVSFFSKPLMRDLEASNQSADGSLLSSCGHE